MASSSKLPQPGASKPTPSSTASTWPSWTATLSSPAAPVYKFSSDIERLQKMLSVSKSPAGAQIKRVLDLLNQKRKALTPEQIKELSYVDVNRNKDVFESLNNNPRVRYDGSCYSYKDAYPTVMEDLQSLKASGDVFLLKNAESKGDIAYPNDLPPATINVDSDLKSLFFEVELPRDMLDVEKYLKKNGIKPKTDNAKRRAMAQQVPYTAPKPKKKQRKINPDKATNRHMPEFFI